MSISFPPRSLERSAGLRLKLGGASIALIKDAFEAKHVTGPFGSIRMPPEAKVTDLSKVPPVVRGKLAKLDEQIKGEPAEVFALKLSGYDVLATLKEDSRNSMQYTTLFTRTSQELASGYIGDMDGFNWA